jgi:hypothetical protein
MEKGKAETSDGGGSNRVRTYIALALVVLAVAMLVVWLTSGDDDSSQGNSDQRKSRVSQKAKVVSVDALRTAAAQEPIYWAGARQGARLELSRPEAGRTFVRYLTEGAEPGNRDPDYLTVGTYASTNPAAKLRRQGKEPGGVLGTAPGGAVVYFNRSEPLSVYVAFPGVDAQIEVYDPAFNQALRLVNSGQIVPVD